MLLGLSFPPLFELEELDDARFEAEDDLFDALLEDNEVEALFEADVLLFIDALFDETFREERFDGLLLTFPLFL
jgi:hypothetical protein